MAVRRQEFVALRKAAGYTQESLAAELSVGRSTIIRWEAGENEPLPFHWPKLASLLGVSTDQLRQLLAGPVGQVSYSPAAVATGAAAPTAGAAPMSAGGPRFAGGPTAVDASAVIELLNTAVPVVHRRVVLAGSAAAALVLDNVEALRRKLAEAVDQAAMSEASLDDWEHTIHQYGLAYRYRPAASLLVDLAADFAELNRLLERRRPAILVPSRLTRVVAQMTGLLCATLLRLDQHAAARDWARTAKIVAKESGDRKLHAWVLSQEAYSHYYDGNLVRAVLVATQAQHVANHAPCPGVAQTAGLEARVYALHGKEAEAHAALGRAERALGGLEAEMRMPSGFCYDEAKFAHHAGNAYTHLGRTTEAAGAQERALALYPRADYFNRPLVMLDRADCLIQDNDVPAAVEYAKQALCAFGTERRTPVVDSRARQVLGQIPAKAITLPAVQELRDLLHDKAAK
jgi:DNA-binding XRE family transcriptional regulator/tetratricopeptide (TPR) repeat protein